MALVHRPSLGGECPQVLGDARSFLKFKIGDSRGGDRQRTLQMYVELTNL